MTLEKALQILIGNQEDKKAESFLKFLSDKLWDQYKEHIMDKIKMVNGELKWNLNIPNAKENIEYNQTVRKNKIRDDNEETDYIYGMCNRSFEQLPYL